MKPTNQPSPLGTSLQSALSGIATEPRPSMPRIIAAALRAAIIDGSLAPGEPLRQDALARHFSVSAIPVREAFRQLESEGWITVEPNKGATVSPLSADEAREIYEIRAALESLAIGLAIPNHTRESLAAAEQLLHAAAKEPDEALYVMRNEEFHASLYQPADRPRLMQMIEGMYRRGERYQRLKFGMPSFKGESDSEHEAIFAAVVRADVAAAQSLLTRHLLNTADLLFRFLSAAGNEPPAENPAPSSGRRTRPGSSKRKDVL